MFIYMTSLSLDTKVANTAGNRPIQLLIDSLRSSDPNERFEASLQLREKENTEIVEPLIRCLDSGDSKACCSAAWVLGSIGARESIPQLIRASNSENKVLNFYSIWALSKLLEDSIYDPQIEESLILSLKSSDLEIRKIAALALGKQKREEAMEGLIECLADEDPDVKCETAWILGNLGEAGIINKKATEILIKYLEDEDSAVKRLSAEALGKIRNPEAIGPLIILLKSEKDYEVTWYAACALGKMPEAIAPLMEYCVTDSDPIVRLYTFDVLTNRQEKKVFSLLLLASTDVDRCVREFARERFSELNDDVVNQGLNMCLENSNIQVLITILQALGNVRDPRVVPTLVKYYIDEKENPLVRESARHGLAKIEQGASDKIISPLEKYLSHVLKRKEEKNILLEGLELCLKGNNESVRTWAQNVLDQVKKARSKK